VTFIYLVYEIQAIKNITMLTVYLHCFENVEDKLEDT